MQRRRGPARPAGKNCIGAWQRRSLKSSRRRRRCNPKCSRVTGALAAEAEPTIAAWRMAGDAALAHRSYKEAQEPFQQAVMILSTIDESPERDARELELISALADVLYVTGGYTAPDYIAATARARTLAEKSGNLLQLVQRLHGTWQAAQVSA